MRTLDELEDDLSEEIAWRRTELQAFLAQVRAARGASLSSLCRAGVALLYAHWEGYAKHALSQYLRYVARRKLTLEELESCFVAMALNAKVARVQGLSVTNQATQIIELIRDIPHERLHIPSKDGVDTRSNLNSALCLELFASVGLDGSPFKTKSALIDYNLLGSRNKIAHGEFLSIDRGGYEELHHEVIEMLATIKRIVIDGAENKRYRKGL